MCFRNSDVLWDWKYASLSNIRMNYTCMQRDSSESETKTISLVADCFGAQEQDGEKYSFPLVVWCCEA